MAISSQVWNELVTDIRNVLQPLGVDVEGTVYGDGDLEILLSREDFSTFAVFSPIETEGEELYFLAEPSLQDDPDNLFVQVLQTLSTRARELNEAGLMNFVRRVATRFQSEIRKMEESHKPTQRRFIIKESV